jgi:hypothetical protein
MAGVASSHNVRPAGKALFLIVAAFFGNSALLTWS